MPAPRAWIHRRRGATSPRSKSPYLGAIRMISASLSAARSVVKSIPASLRRLSAPNVGLATTTTFTTQYFGPSVPRAPAVWIGTTIVCGFPNAAGWRYVPRSRSGLSSSTRIRFAFANASCRTPVTCHVSIERANTVVDVLHIRRLDERVIEVFVFRIERMIDLERSGSLRQRTCHDDVAGKPSRSRRRFAGYGPNRVSVAVGAREDRVGGSVVRSARSGVRSDSRRSSVIRSRAPPYAGRL